jgi:hypothetical protein
MLPDDLVENIEDMMLDVSTDEFLSADRAFTYADLHAMIGDGKTVAWLTPHAAVVCEDDEVDQSWMQLPTFCFNFNADGKEVNAWARSHEHLLEICDVVLRLLAASVVRSVTLDEGGCLDGVLINAPILAYLLEQCQSIKAFTLVNLLLDENHCRALGDYSRPGLEIDLRNCDLTSAGTRALAEVFRRNQGPTKLYDCVIDNIVLADGLRGNSRLKSLTPLISSNHETGKLEVLAIVDALKENKGLVELDLSTRCFRKNDETWGAVCDSLKTHPTLEVLNLSSALTDATIAPAVIKSRIQALLDMAKVNLSIRTILLASHRSEHELFQGSVLPYRKTNRFRPRLLAIQKARPIPYRAKVLGRALIAARTDANSFWMLLSGNAEVAFPPSDTTIAAAMNLPTPATTAANVAADAASVMSACTATAASSLPSAAEAVATSAGTPSTASASDAFASAPTVTADASVHALLYTVSTVLVDYHLALTCYSYVRISSAKARSRPRTKNMCVRPAIDLARPSDTVHTIFMTYAEKLQ